MRLARLGLLTVPLLAWLTTRVAPDSPPEPARLRFTLRAQGGAPMPARLTFVPEGSDPGAPAPVFAPETFARAPGELAVRENVVYTKSGTGTLEVPPGRYTVTASRGLEWSLVQRELELVSGAEALFEAELVRELDTTGWIGADFHLHTLTHSGHGDAELAERLLSCLGEGLEFAVATDHNHHTDYAPSLAALALPAEHGAGFAVTTGNEVSTPIGHFNAFPLEPTLAPVDPEQTDARELFRRVRAQRGPAGETPVIQVNHPRLEGIDYFTRTGLDPVTGKSAQPAYAPDFDALEILNENLALGFDDPVTSGRDTHGHAHSALVDWYHLLDRGARPAAVGNSDSHHVQAIVAGFPRNFVRVDDARPAAVTAGAVAEAVRTKQLFTTTGPFVEYSVEGVAMGGEARAVDGHARLALRVRAASWVDTTRVLVVVDGAVEHTLATARGPGVLRLEQELELCLLGTCARHGRTRADAPGARDAWVTLLVEGERSLAPILRAEARPLALANPVWIDGDGDGRWTSPLERVAALLRAQKTPDLTRRWFDTLGPNEQALALGEVARGPYAGVLVTRGLESSVREVQLAAARAAERVALPAATPALGKLWQETRDDPYLGALLARVQLAGAPARAGQLLAAYHGRFGAAALRRHADELLPLVPGGAIAGWSVLGPLALDAPEGSRAGGLPLGPPARAQPLAPDGSPLTARELAPDAAGYLDLVGLGGHATDQTLVVAEAWLASPDARRVLLAFGSDDGGRVWLGDEKCYENLAAKASNPLEALVELALQPGWNRLRVEVENGRGGFGFHARLLDPAVQSAARRP